MATRYFITLPDASRARAAGELPFQSQGAEGLAQELQQALATDRLFQQWRAKQPEPDDVDPGLGVTDAGASVQGRQQDLQIELTVITSIPGEVLKHRLRLLAGQTWQLRDVTAA